MASATQPKRMVSSVFITLAPPYQATLTKPQHTLQTHKAPARDKQHAAVRVDPSDGVHTASLRHRKESCSAEFEAGKDGEGKMLTVLPAGRSDPRSVPSPSAMPQLHKDGTGEERFPPPPVHPAHLCANPSEDMTPTGPPYHQEGTSPPSSPTQPPTHNKQQKMTPSSGDDSGKVFHSTQTSEQDTSPESKEVCGFCRKAVAFAEPAIEALNRTYHDSCFQCRQCQIPLAGKLYYNKAGIPLCEDCYQASLELCWACGDTIKDLLIRALERTYHLPCFTCATCHQQIGEQRFAQGEVGEVYCIQDYYRKYAPQCSACKQLIIPKEDGTDSYTVECQGGSFHEDCYRCEICAIQLSPEPNDHGCHPLDGRILCKACHLILVSA